MRATIVLALVSLAAATAAAQPSTTAPAAAPAAPAPAAAPPLPIARATVLHVPVAESAPGVPVELVAAVDAAWAEPALVVRYRGPGATLWQEEPFRHSSTGGWYATLPATAIAPPGAEYYIVGRGPAGEQLHFGSDVAPQIVRVEPTVADRLEAIDAIRTEGRTETVRFDVDAHNFTNRYKQDDAFLRGEIVWTHRVSRTLHSIGFGFGAIQGRTPQVDPMAESVTRAARYGAADARVRLHPSVYADARLVLGVSHDGFMGGFAGAVTLGKPWRSNVSMGVEFLEDVGSSQFIRLQWDTAPPLLMGAAIYRTDLPGVLISPQGLLIRYDLSYAVSPGFALRGALSYGARDGAAGFGGSLGTAVSF